VGLESSCFLPLFTVSQEYVPSVGHSIVHFAVPWLQAQTPGLRGWEFCTICQFSANFSAFTNISQVPVYVIFKGVENLFSSPSNIIAKITLMQQTVTTDVLVCHGSS
jgi:hypothetical protein